MIYTCRGTVLGQGTVHALPAVQPHPAVINTGRTTRPLERSLSFEDLTQHNSPSGERDWVHGAGTSTACDSSDFAVCIHLTWLAL